MSARTEALVRELAGLFVKYRLSEWAPLVEELERRGGSSALADAIRRHAQDARSAASRAKARESRAPGKAAGRSKPAQLELAPRFTGPHATTVEDLRQALLGKRALPSLSSLKAVSAALGIKAPASKRREALVGVLTAHLDGLDADAFANALRVVARGEEGQSSGAMPDYDRWFDLITADRRSVA